jgi:hypothetical protein
MFGLALELDLMFSLVTMKGEIELPVPSVPAPRQLPPKEVIVKGVPEAVNAPFEMVTAGPDAPLMGKNDHPPFKADFEHLASAPETAAASIAATSKKRFILNSVPMIPCAEARRPGEEKDECLRKAGNNVARLLYPREVRHEFGRAKKNPDNHEIGLDRTRVFNPFAADRRRQAYLCCPADEPVTIPEPLHEPLNVLILRMPPNGNTGR